MRQIESSCECRRTIHYRIRRQPLRTWRHLTAQTMPGLARLPPARHRPSKFSRQCLLALRVLEIPVPLRPRSTPTRRVLQSSTVQEAHQESTGSPSPKLLRREELIQDSMRKTTLANLETNTLKAFRNVFAHHKNA